MSAAPKSTDDTLLRTIFSIPDRGFVGPPSPEQPTSPESFAPVTTVDFVTSAALAATSAAALAARPRINRRSARDRGHVVGRLVTTLSHSKIYSIHAWSRMNHVHTILTIEGVVSRVPSTGKKCVLSENHAEAAIMNSLGEVCKQLGLLFSYMAKGAK